MALPLRVQLEPRSIDVTPSEPFTLTVEIYNASEIIEGYEIVLLGLDPDWVTCDPGEVSLFPDAEEAVSVTVTLPGGFLAGEHRVAVKVQPRAMSDQPWIGEIGLNVDARDDATLVVEPQSVTAGRTAKFTVKVSNDGNRPLTVKLDAVDAEQAVAASFSQNPIEVAPGTVTPATMTASAKRPLLGPVTPRVITVTGQAKGIPLQSIATFLQRAWIPRSILTLLAILLALGAWALLLLYGIDRIVPDDETTTTTVAEPVTVGAIVGSAQGVEGTVLVGAIAEAFAPDSLSDPETAPVAAAMGFAGDDGMFRIEGLADGPYFLRVTDPRTKQAIWHPDAPTAETGAIVVIPEVEPDEETGKAEVEIGVDPIAFGLTRDVTGIVTDEAGKGRQHVVVEAFAANPTADPELEPIAGDQFVNGGGAFDLDALPVPGAYFVRFSSLPFADRVLELALTSDGVATEGCAPVSEVIDCQVTLSPGDGVVTGIVDNGTVPLAGTAVVLANGLGQRITTTTDGDGRYTFEDLNTPDSYKVSADVEGYQPAALTVELMPDTPVDDLGFLLVGKAGTIAGSVWGGAGGVGEVMVVAESALGMGMAVTNTEGDNIGFFTITDLPTPGIYTLTFSKEGLEEVILIVVLEAGGSDTDVTVEPAVDLAEAIAAGDAEPASVTGKVVDAEGDGIGEVAVEISDGENMLMTMTTEDGDFQVTGIEVAGAYTVTFTKDRLATRVLLIEIEVGEQKDLGEIEMEPTDPIPVEDMRLRTDGLGPFNFGDDGDVVADRLELAFAVEGLTRNDPVPTFVAGDLGTCVDQDVEFIRFGTLIVINVTTDGDKRFAAYRLGDTTEDPTGASKPGDELTTLSGLRIGHRLVKANQIYTDPVFEVNTFGTGGSLTYQVLRVSDGKLLLYGRLLDVGVPGASDEDRILTINSPNACDAG